MGRSWGGSGNHFFQERSAKASPWGSRGGFGTIFLIFGALRGSLGPQFSEKKLFLFRSAILVDFGSNFGEGRRNGRGLPGLENLQIRQEALELV